MRKDKKTARIMLEALGYSFFGTVFVIFVDILKSPKCVPDFSCDTYAARGIPPGGVLIAALVSVVLANILFGRIIKSEFAKWSFILTTTAILPILIQTAYIISKTDLAFEQIISIYSGRIGELLGFGIMIELFLILTPFTILFASRRTIIEKIKNKTALE